LLIKKNCFYHFSGSSVGVGVGVGCVVGVGVGCVVGVDVAGGKDRNINVNPAPKITPI
jgi:hypothetical protein